MEGKQGNNSEKKPTEQLEAKSFLPNAEAGSFLPNAAEEDWFDCDIRIQPKSKLIDGSKFLGVNTGYCVHPSARRSVDFRDIPIPKIKVSPWNESTIEFEPKDTHNPT